MRICSRCKDQIKRGHRFHTVESRLFGLLWTVKRPEHYSCPNPTHGPVATPRRIKGEVPLPFPEPDVMNAVTPLNAHDFVNSNDESPRDELARLN
jgi:hypothetical protein